MKMKGKRGMKRFGGRKLEEKGKGVKVKVWRVERDGKI